MTDSRAYDDADFGPQPYLERYDETEEPRASWIARIVGLVVLLIGLVLTAGGGYLAWLGGSPYYVVTGVAMLVSGILLMRSNPIGGWLYIAIVLATVGWAWWETGPDAWAQVPRIVAPVVLLVFVILAMAGMSWGTRRWRAALGAILVALLLAAGNFWLAADRGAARVLADLPAPNAAGMADPALLQVGADWPAAGGTTSSRHYSPLQQINPDNVGRLQRAWLAHTGDLPASPKAQDKYGAETTPLKIGDRLYLCSAKNIMIALDAATGREAWRYDPKVSDDWIPYTAACRGVAYYEVPGARALQPCGRRIIEGTLDGRLIAVDARNGNPCPGFGQNGQVDIKAGMGPVEPGMVSITAPPVIVRGVVVTGHQVLDGQKNDAPSGVIQGFDAVTGELRWGWDMMHPEWTGLPPRGEHWARGTPNSWTASTGDEALGLVYVPLGNSAVDYLSADRAPQENFYASSLVAIDVATGKPRWRFQTVKKDVWDYDLGAQATLVDWPVPGGAVPALVLPSKQGDLYVLDRRTGQRLTPAGRIAAPGGGVEPEQRSPVQYASTWANLRKPDLAERDMWGMSPIDQMLCRIQFRQASYQGFYTPPTSDRHFVQYPGYNGGTDWGGIAVDPLRGVIVANYNDMPNYNRLVPRAVADPQLAEKQRAEARGGRMSHAGLDPQYGAPYAIEVNAGWRMPFTKLLCKEPPYGGIRAIDMRTGKTIWDRPFGEARTNGPFGIPSMLPLTIGTPNNGGAVVTASGLIFIAAATDNLIRAIDLRTGKTLWEDTLPAGGQATPMTYEVGGRQYLVIVAGGHHFMETPIGDSVVAYALPQG